MWATIGSVIKHKEFETKTGGRFDILDITDDVAATVAETGITDGSVLIFSPHTTCCVLISASGNDIVETLARTVAAIAPEHDYYEHDDLTVRTENLVEDEPANGPAHIAHAVLGKASESVPVLAGRLGLGAGQRILLVELDSSRQRRYLVQTMGE